VISETSLIYGSECRTLISRDKQRIAKSNSEKQTANRNLPEVNKMSDDIKEYQEKWRSHVQWIQTID
jgi:hypothetical protein